MPTPVRFLRSDEIDDLAEPSEYVAPVRAAYRQRGEGAPAKPRTALESDDPPGLLTGYFAILPDSGAMGGYTYAAGFGGADAHFVLPLFDAHSGTLTAILDGASLNPWKTGATGAVAVDALARPDATTVGLIGSGAQARGQLLATAAVRDLAEVAVYSPTPANRETFAAEMDSRLAATVRPVDTSAAAIDDADVVITATRAETPVFDGAALADGTHVTAMGQYHPEKREIDAETVARATYVPDLRERVHQDAGAFLLAKAAGRVDDDHVHAELGEVVAGRAPGRTSPAEITLFDSGGTAIETVAAAHFLAERARERDVGQPLSFAPASEAMPGK